MAELKEFYNRGFGWICRRCEKDLDEQRGVPLPSRLLREGEGESKQPFLSTRALAKWADDEQRTLLCPRCGTTESIEKF